VTWRHPLTATTPHVNALEGFHPRNVPAIVGPSLSSVSKTVTRTPAEILGIDDRVGTLEPGTDADVAVWNGEFWRVDSRTQHAFDREEDSVDPRATYAWERRSNRSVVDSPVHSETTLTNVTCDTSRPDIPC